MSHRDWTLMYKNFPSFILHLSLQSFSLLDNDANYTGSLVTEVRLTGDSQATVQVKHGLHTHELHLAAGTLLATSLTSGHYVNTHYHDQLLTDMMESHLVKDFCLIGPPVSPVTSLSW